MPLTEVLPQLRELSRGDKLRLIQVLADDLAREDEAALLPAGEYPVWSQYDAFEGAAQLQQFIDGDKVKAQS